MAPRPPLYRQIYAPGTVYSAWIEEFIGMHELVALYNRTMHPQFTGRPSRFNMLDKLIRFIKKDGDVWITTYRDIAEYVRGKPAATPKTR